MRTTFRFALWEVALCIVAIGGVGCFFMERIAPLRDSVAHPSDHADSHGDASMSASCEQPPGIFYPAPAAEPISPTANHLRSKESQEGANVAQASYTSVLTIAPAVIGQTAVSSDWTVRLARPEDAPSAGILLQFPDKTAPKRINYAKVRFQGRLQKPGKEIASIKLRIGVLEWDTTSIERTDNETIFTFDVTLTQGLHEIEFLAQPVAAGSKIEKSTPAYVAVRLGQVAITGVDRSSWSRPSGHELVVTMNTAELGVRSNDTFATRPEDFKAKISLIRIDKKPASGDPPNLITQVVLNGVASQFELAMNDLEAGVYELRIGGGPNGIVDLYLNELAATDQKAPRTDFVMTLFKPVVGDAPSESRGLTAPGGPPVDFPEFANPRKVPDGFNPEDKVETRVAHLYYYRDAHRVAQIINRTAQSYNRAGVEMRRQLADQARREADLKTEERRHLEREAVEAARESRQKERELVAAQQNLQASVDHLGKLQDARDKEVAKPDKPATPDPMELPPPGGYEDAKTVTDLKSQITLAEATANSLGHRVAQLRTDIQNLRDQEAQANELAQQADGQERLLREDQFRKEVAAAREDPNTYAPGLLTSDDPVRQVSVSVIGEGLLHLRGPIKGINLIRNMIHQIDSPVGQVRVAVHTIQVNGERADRMEEVADNIQKHIDQARFLTLRSGELFRKAVVHVASRKAEEGRALFPGNIQDDRDQRYLHAFFGKDFIDELQAMDSEFLHSGNKILSLHSMDTTSLSSALLMTSLAKNSTRLEILNEFEGLCQGELPAAEQNYIQSGIYCAPDKKKKHPKGLTLCFLGRNAQFESLRGFFNAEGTHDDTLTPLQREFIRLAQIFKSRVITEMEYKQRVTERAIIEQRLGNRLQELQDAANDENTAKALLRSSEEALAAQHNKVSAALDTVLGTFEGILSKKAQADIAALDERFSRIANYVAERKKEGQNTGILEIPGERIAWQLSEPDGKYVVPLDERQRPVIRVLVRDALATAESLSADVSQRLILSTELQTVIHGISDDLSRLRTQIETELAKTRTDSTMFETENIHMLARSIGSLRAIIDESGFVVQQERIIRMGNDVLTILNDENRSYREALAAWIAFRDQLYETMDQLLASEASKTEIREDVKDATDGFRTLVGLDYQDLLASQRAEQSRRPLDHKKFLDMLISDIEDKYVELLDGTRAHTANIDNYIKRLTTALDDDFNNQFYYPAFRGIRRASTYYDVQFGQTETTSVLANNRGFAKVSPQATMEFDLPERDIVLAEAINGAKAVMDDVGALANDPSFLALAKLKSGQGPATPAAGSTNGASTVRSVLPGLDGTTSEQFLAQNGPGRNQFGAALENLIPDPAIYKFETGTGFEIRPVVQPDGQAVVFGFHYMYTTNVREPVRPDEKHLGRVKRHFIDTDVQLSNYELREVSRYQVALKAARTAKGVPLLEDIPVAGVLFRPLPSQESSLQQNQIMAQATIFPTLFDLMGLRWAPAVTDLDPLRLTNEEFVVRGRKRHVENRVYDHSSEKADEFLREPPGSRRPDLYRSQETIPHVHPNGYEGPGLGQRDSTLQEGFQPNRAYPQMPYSPSESKEGSPLNPQRLEPPPAGTYIEPYPLQRQMERPRTPQPLRNGFER